MKNTKKGFTLVELLIVITVFGVLSEVMMFTKSEAISSAKAGSIINNLRNIKFVVSTRYADSMDVYISEPDSNLPDEITKHISKYLGGDAEDLENYYVTVDKNSNKNSWWICYDNVTDEIRDKLINKGLKAENNIVALQIR